VECNLGETLEWLDQHKGAHAEPNPNCAFCQRPQSPESLVRADLEQQLGRRPTRAEVAADPRVIAFDARRRYELAVMAAQFGVQPKG
jgi:hypothetical protein